MSEQDTRVRTMSLSLVRVRLSKCLNQVCFGGKRIVVTSHGEPKAAIISIKDLRRLQEDEQARADRVQQKPVSNSSGKETKP
jgi:prevent-host-death family protein